MTITHSSVDHSRIHATHRHLVLGTSLLALILFSGAAGAQEHLDVVDKAVARYGELKTARGKLEVNTRRMVLGSTKSSTGVFQQQFPDKLSILISEPNTEALVTDGSFIWFYAPVNSPGRVRKCKAEEVGGINLVKLFLDSPRTKYTISSAGSAEIGGRATVAVGLVPKEPMAEFGRATVWIEAATGLIWQYETTSPNRDVVQRYRITEMAVDVPVDASAFTFVRPSGVREVGCSG